MAGLHLPPVYVETGWWPLEMASQNPSTEQLLQVMHKYAKGDTVDFDDEEAAEAWLLWAKSASACGANLTVSCVLNNAAAQKNWSAGGIQAPVAKLSPVQPEPATVALLRPSPGQAERLRLPEGHHAADAEHLELQPEERRHTFTPQQVAALASS